MKKLIIFIAILFLSFKTNEEQKYKFEFTAEQLQIIFTAVDNSNAPHDKVKEIEVAIQQQYSAQLPKPDSTKNKK